MSIALRGLVRRWRIISGAVLAASMGCLVFGPLLLAYIADGVLALMLACLLGLTALSITRQICRLNSTTYRPDYAAIARMERDVWGEAFEHAGDRRQCPATRPDGLCCTRRRHEDNLHEDGRGDTWLARN